MVATFYCFLTSEVRNETKKRIKRWKWSRNISGGGGSHASNRSMSVFHSNFNHTQVTQIAAGRSSLHNASEPKVVKFEHGKKSDEDKKTDPLLSDQTNKK